ncbi:MAG: NAD(P)/FAD-dependent oxidoreductase [Elusimicrobiota bacterium]
MLPEEGEEGAEEGQDRPSRAEAFTDLIIGGGAAGFFAAAACAKDNPRARAAVLERGREVLAKVRISGGGRCNVTHACFEPKELADHYPRGGRALLGPFHRFQPRDAMEWFEARGAALKIEPDGRVFPTTDRSQTIVEALAGAAREAGVEVRTGARVEAVHPRPGGGFSVALRGGGTLACDRLLLATGGSPAGLAWAAALGHAVEPPVPSLFTFTISDGRLQGLSGVSVERAALRLAGTALRQEGPVLITHWGLSGPAVLKLSAWGARTLHGLGYRAKLTVNWTGRDAEQIREELRAHKNLHPRKSVAGHGPFGLPRRLWERLASAAGARADERWADVSGAVLKRLEEELSAGVYEVRGKSAYKDEFVTCGGVRLSEVDFRTMESRLRPGLYFAGEILDIDAVTGGFNFQSAWTTGWLAGRAMAAAGAH